MPVIERIPKSPREILTSDTLMSSYASSFTAPSLSDGVVIGAFTGSGLSEDFPEEQAHTHKATTATKQPHANHFTAGFITFLL